MWVTISDDELDAIEARAAAATAGPWESSIEGRDHDSGDSFILTGGMDPDAPDIYVTMSYRQQGSVRTPAADLDFIASARQDVPRLVSELRALRSTAE